MTTPNERVKILRETLNLKITHFANAIGYTQGTLSSIESGKSAVEPRLARVLHLAFGVNEDWLLKGTGGEKPIFDNKITDDEEEIAFRFLRDTIDQLSPERKEIIVRLIKRLADDKSRYKIEDNKKKRESGENENLQIPRRKVG